MDLEKSINTPYGRVTFRPYTPEDESDVLDAWQAAFGQPMEPAIWRWKFHDNPYGRHMMMALNEAKEPIAMYNGVPVPGTWDGIPIRFTQLMDHFSHPAYRQVVEGRKGIFVLLADHFFDCWGGTENGSIFHYGFPGQKHFKLGKLFLDYTRVQPMTYFRVTPRQLRQLFAGQSWELATITRELFDQLWANQAEYYPISVNRDFDFLNWRFFSHPIRQYATWVSHDRSGKPVAYVIAHRDANTLRVADVFGARLSISEWKKLWRQIGRLWHQEGIQEVEMWLASGHFITQSLYAMGLQPSSEPFGVIPGGRSFDPRLRMEWMKSHFFFTQADLDLL